MGDSKRFNLFADIVHEHVNSEAKVADIAGGKGYLQIALRERGFNKVETWDKRTRNKKSQIRKSAINQRYSYFEYDRVEDKYEAVVAMHPDEGTDHSILFAAKHRIQAIICPCCVKPSATMFWESHKYGLWKEHLINLGRKNNMEVIERKLKMNGRNDVLIFKP